MTIGVDLGGTNIRAGVEQEGTIIAQNQVSLENKESLPSTLTQIIELIRPLQKHPVTGIGIGVPSVVDVERGIVYHVTNIPSWKEVPLKDILEEATGLPVFVNNDVNCFVLGEHRFGEARSYNSVVGMAIGTGLGSGIIINGHLYVGSNCGAGEIGLVPYLDKNLEYYASSNFFLLHGTTALAANQAARQADPEALKLWETFGRHMGMAVKVAVYMFDPEAIVLGGSIAKGFAFFDQSLQESLQDFEFPESIRRLKILQSRHQNIALLGAAALVPRTAMPPGE